MENSELDQRLVKWNDIFKELIIDVRTLTHDLREGVRYIFAAGIVMICLGILNLIYNVDQFWRGPLFVAVVVLATAAPMTIGLVNIVKFVQLRERYVKLYELQRRIETS